MVLFHLISITSSEFHNYNEFKPNQHDYNVTFNCPPRTEVSDRPSKISFDDTKWISKKYAASTFNVCPHKPLKQISGPPLKIYLETNAYHKTAHVLVNW